MKTNLKYVAAIIASSFLWTGCCTNRPATQWEYKVIEKKLYPQELEKQLNESASSGWSVFTVTAVSQGEPLVPKGYIVLRRPKLIR